MQAHVDNARIVAEWLEADPRIEFVNWAGLASHPHHERATQVPAEGARLGVQLRGEGRPATPAGRFIESVDLASHLANIGDAKTLVIHPASTTHAQLTEQQLLDAGVLPGLVRISVGIEDPDDIIYDLDQALTRATEGHVMSTAIGTPGSRDRHPSCRTGSAATLPADSPLAKLLNSQRTWVGPSAKERLGILRKAKSVAIVGASPNPARSSYFVGTYLQQSSDYRALLRQPERRPILGQKVYADLADLPEVPDIVDVFRKASDIPSVIDDVVAVGAPTVWVQLGIWNQDAAVYGESKGLTVVMDRCIKVEHARFHGGLHLLRLRHRRDFGEEERPLTVLVP